MKSIIINFTAFAAVMSFGLFVEFVKALDIAGSGARYHFHYKAPENANGSSDPTYPLPAMRILQIW